MNYYGSYEYMYDPSLDAAAATIFIIYLFVLMIWGIFALAGYIMKGIGLYTIAKRQGEGYPWLAFIPFARTYLQGELGGDIVLKKKSIRNPGVWLIVIPFIEGAAIFIFYLLFFGIMGITAISSVSYYGPGAGSVLSLILVLLLFILVMILFGSALQILKIMVNHQILEKFTTKNMSIIHAILMGIIPLYEPICFLIMSRKSYNPGMEPKEKPFIQNTVPPMQGSYPPVPPAYGVTPEQGFVPQRGLLNPNAEQENKPEINLKPEAGSDTGSEPAEKEE